MDLVKIDHVDGKAPKTVLDFAADRVGIQYFLHLTVGTPPQAALGKDVRSEAAPLLKSTADHFLGVYQTVHGGRVDPVDAEFERAVNSGDGLVVVLRPPGELPARPADRPSSVADGSDMQVGVAKLAYLHFNPLSKLRGDVHRNFRILAHAIPPLACRHVFLGFGGRLTDPLFVARLEYLTAA